MTPKLSIKVAAALYAVMTVVHIYLCYSGMTTIMSIAGFLALTALEISKIVFVNKSRAKYGNEAGTRILATEVITFGLALGLLFVFASPIECRLKAMPIVFCIDLMVLRTSSGLILAAKK
ncbi:MAG: hypothetical protein J6Y72_00740 [Bacteroidales bacterium]|jgi:hypothetical protein|nr:hypothetical protein [Bacteroidales bacterium]MBP5418327.1 hypothetical protein [Bacteroidales bacterium]MCR5695687.1 hypothetical protein [Marinilabiliaceae bacterium]